MGILKSIPCSTLLTCLILVGCGAGDTPTPTATIAPTEIAPVSASLGISRMRIQSEFKSASFEFTTHGDSEWISGMFFDGSGTGIILDIFGPAHDVEAVELTFFKPVPMNIDIHEVAISQSYQLLLETVIPDWAEGPQWVAEHVARFGTQGDQTVQVTYGDKIITLYYRDGSNLGVVSVEGDTT